MTVYIVETWENIPYGEYIGIEGVYLNEEATSKFKSDENYHYMITEYTVKETK